ncbi:MAG: hypothetical protein LBS60_03660 [Deltaproteobacteria bacterium]|nr:hypothetical protein [Deltaproteobacteria bacterium]
MGSSDSRVALAILAKNSWGDAFPPTQDVRLNNRPLPVFRDRLKKLPKPSLSLFFFGLAVI